MTLTEKLTLAGVLVVLTGAAWLTVLAVREVRECGGIALVTQERDGAEFTAFECAGVRP